MSLVQWFAAGAAILFTLFIGVFLNTAQVLVTPAPNVASSTLVVASGTPPAITIENLLPTLATSTPVKPKIPTVMKPPSVAEGGISIAIPPIVLPPPALIVTQSDFEAAAANVRAALVNILCTSHTTNLQSISGSGIVVDPRGIFLTNAHIAQYFLLASDPAQHVSCVVRSGSPAQSAYEANLMFISPAWLRANADILSKSLPTGTGERDFALLAITGSTQNPLPSSSPFVPLSKNDVFAGEPVVIGSYAAQFLTSAEIRSDLYPTIVFGSIQDIFTFGETTVDVFSLGGSAAAQEGSSGGGVVDAKGNLIGIIVTSTIEGDTSTRNVSAISSTYIARDYISETGNTLSTLFAQTPTSAVAAFAPQIPYLEQIITPH